MRRAEIWTISGGADHAGKARPAVILQDDAFDALDSVTVCPFTSLIDPPAMHRILVEPSDLNGLMRPSCLMVDKVSTVARAKLGRRVGVLGDAEMARLGRALILFFGLAHRSAT